ncbi:MAG: sulfite exporter TauE/SafE family protein [Spirochaetaceae bacterium]|jgi:sulfite exporter TauE/SafE/copper chaperone CopZ/plastocyanin domain-containing protein|nr:sulfite exporter TauE/SafE family protein [Spirochaetaceae bacterium]
MEAREDQGECKTRTLRIGGMSCVHCQEKIEGALRAAEGITAVQVSYRAGTARVTYDRTVISLDAIEGIIEGLGYEVLSGGEGRRGLPSGAARAAGFLVVIIAGAMVMQGLGVSVFSAFPTAEAGMGLGMMFLIGLITSVHCLGMCGGINLSQTLGGPREGRRLDALMPSLLYNGGRVVSYTLIGGIVGAAGSVVSFSGRARGAFQLAAGVFMVIMGVNMLGIFPFLRALTPRLPPFIAKRIDRAKARSGSPLLIGLLNGLMPCGPLQAMQLYALSTGSAPRGAASMLLFSLGTVPLMFGLGALGGFLSARPSITRRVMAAGACIVAAMGITMAAQGWALSGLSLRSLLPSGTQTAFERPASAVSAGGSAAEIIDGVQVVTSTLSPGRYPAITVMAGIPVRWTINAPQGSITGCNNRMFIPEYGIEYRFRQGKNLIEFTPGRTGKFRYSCWMGMIRSTITVVADRAALAAAPDTADPGVPVPAGYRIPSADLAIAERAVYQGTPIQRAAVRLTDEGFSPAVMVVERDLPVEWIIDNRSAKDGSAELRVPAYTAVLDLQKQAQNVLYFQPQDDFDFSTGDSAFFGYVKVVDDITAIDREGIQREAAAFETLVYPEDYFYSSQDGGGCCGRR